MKELPCKQLHCELLERLAKGLSPLEFTLSIAEMKDKASKLTFWFADHNIEPKDALGIMELLKASCWAAIIKDN